MHLEFSIFWQAPDNLHSVYNHFTWESGDLLGPLGRRLGPLRGIRLGSLGGRLGSLGGRLGPLGGRLGK